MTLQELQKQVLKLPMSQRWLLVQTLLESIQQETQPVSKKGNLSWLRGIAKGTDISSNENIVADYVSYLTEKYQWCEFLLNSNILAGGRKMTTMKVELQLSSDDLLKAVEQLSQADLKQFISQVIALQAQRTAPSLMQQESELLLKINQVISVEIQNYYNDLIAKRDTETLTDEEHRELLNLTEQIEKQQAQRIEYLVELANLRGISLNALMESLGIQMQVYVWKKSYILEANVE